MSTVVVITIVLALLVGASANKFFKKDDSIPEEIAEDVIKSQTGLDIDFTPESKEK